MKITETKIQFIPGFDEKVLPNVYLTRSRNGSTGTATFQFKNPNILERVNLGKGEITGMYLIDEEGVLETGIIYIKFINGRPKIIESIYIMESSQDWDRFIRFMKKYSRINGLYFLKS